MAEAMVAAKAREANLDLVVQSAGLGAAEGIAPPQEAVDAVKRLGHSLGGIRSQPICARLIDEAELILTMTRAQLDILLLQHPQAQGRAWVLREYVQLAEGDDADIPDPFGGTQEDYDACAQLIAEAANKLIDRLKESAAKRE